MTWRRAYDLTSLVAGAVLITSAVAGASDGVLLWLVGGAAILASLIDLFGWLYGFDPTKSGVQQWRQRKRL